MNFVGSAEAEGIADICKVDISLVASLHMLKVVLVEAWFRIFKASSLLVAASNLAASMP